MSTHYILFFRITYNYYISVECDDGQFGINCAKKCYCRTKPCNKFNGICSNGACAKGWQGESCDNGKM